MKNFWQELPKPIYALAPMAGITDSAFRQIAKQFGADVVYGEMASAAGLVYNPKKTLALLEFAEIERPYVVQLFGAKPEHFVQALRLVDQKITARQSGGRPDGIDINFGCPVKKVARQGAGAVLMNDFKLAREIIKAVLANTSLPVSIKIRARVGTISALNFLKNLADLDIKAVMIHGRTMAQGNSGAVDWKIIKQARPLVEGVLLANGGVGTRGGASVARDDARDLLKKTGADGIGIGQGALGKPWIFENVKSQISKVKTKEEIFKIILKHARLAEKLKGKQGIGEMRKHLCWYVSGLPTARALREKLVKVENFNDIKKILR